MLSCEKNRASGIRICLNKVETAVATETVTFMEFYFFEASIIRRNIRVSMFHFFIKYITQIMIQMMMKGLRRFVHFFFNLVQNLFQLNTNGYNINKCKCRHPEISFFNWGFIIKSRKVPWLHGLT